MRSVPIVPGVLRALEARRSASGPRTIGPAGPREVAAQPQRQREGHGQRDDRRQEIDVRHARQVAPLRAIVEALPALGCLLLGCLLLGCLLLGAAVARAAEPSDYVVRGRLEDGALTIDLRVHVSLDEGERSVRLWLYGDRLAVAPATLDERSGRWIYPGEVSLGGYEDVRVEVDGVEARFERVPLESGPDAGGSDLVVPVPDGARAIELHVTARLRVPDRYGRLGRAHGETALLGPWYPLVLGHGEVWEHRTRHDVTLEVADGQAVLLDEAAGTATPAASSVHVETTAGYVPGYAAGTLHRAEVRTLGTRLVVVGGEAEHVPPDGEGMEGVDSFDAIDRLALIEDVWSELLETLRWLEIEPPAELTIVVNRSRVELAAHAPGAVLVSDRLFQIFPLDVVREFHRRALARAMMLEVADRLGRGVEPDEDRAWARDLRSVVLLELDELRRADRAERPEELLSLFSFHPAIDSLLYAPQITFEQVYFGAVDDTDAFRDDPVRARRPITGGRRILESARDALDEAVLERFVARLVHARRPAREALGRVVGEDAPELLERWLVFGTLAVNYRLGAIESRREADGWHHRVEVIRDGDPRHEPVEVDVEDATGVHVVGTWDGEGDRGTVEVVTLGERGTVTIDPRHRLPQSSEVADGHPRADDATSQPFRPPIITAFAFDLLLSEADFTGLLEFAVRQRYDLEHSVTVRLFRSVARTGGRIRYVQGLGPKVHTNRRMGSLGGGLGVNYVEAFGGSTLGGWAVDLDVSGGVDTRSYVYDPREGFSLGAALSATGTAREDGAFNVAVRGALRGGVLVPLGLLNVIAFVGGAGFSVNPSFDADRQGLGGRNVLRGFANDEILATGVIYGVMEHRITALSDLAINVFHLAWVREIQLAWWLGAGGAFETNDGRAALFALEGGAGVRFHYEYGGIQPGVLALDFGVPISRFWDQPSSTRVPLGFYLSFDQFY